MAQQIRISPWRSQLRHRLESPTAGVLKRDCNTFLPSTASFSPFTISSQFHRVRLVSCLKALLTSSRPHMPSMQPAGTSPFDRLPKEIIFGIVDFLSRDPEDVQLRKIMSISKLFQGMLLDFPSCWCTVQVDMANERGYEWLLLHLERSKTQPLEVSIIHRTPCSGSYVGARKLNAVFAHSTRWRSLSLDVNIGILTTQFSPIQGRMPLLASLDLEVRGNSYGDEDWHILPPLFQNSPCLTTASIRTAAKVDLSTLPLHQIQHFWINESFWPPIAQGAAPGPSHLSTLLQTTSQCQHLDVTPSETTQWGHQRTTAPHLVSINIQDYREDMVWLTRLPPLLDILTAPSLRRLTVTSLMPSNMGVIDNFLARSPQTSRNVEVLELMPMTFCPEHRRILHMCPLLTTLTLSFKKISDMDPFQELADPSFLPNLTTAKFLIKADEHPQWLGPRGPKIIYDRWTRPRASDYASSLVDQLVSRRCKGDAPSGIPLHPGLQLLSLQLLWPSEDAAFGFQEYSSQDYSFPLDPNILAHLQEMADVVARGAAGYWRPGRGEVYRLNSMLDDPVLRQINNAQYLYVSSLLCLHGLCLNCISHSVLVCMCRSTPSWSKARNIHGQCPTASDLSTTSAFHPRLGTVWPKYLTTSFPFSQPMFRDFIGGMMLGEPRSILFLITVRTSQLIEAFDGLTPCSR